LASSSIHLKVPLAAVVLEPKQATISGSVIGSESGASPG
jgi:hypothetical protein